MNDNTIDLEEFLIRCGQRLKTYVFNEIEKQSEIKVTDMHLTYESFCYDEKNVAKVWVGENLLGFVSVWFEESTLKVKYSQIYFQQYTPL